MSIISICDVCDKRIEPDREVKVSNLLSNTMLKIFEKKPELEDFDDICPVCSQYILDAMEKAMDQLLFTANLKKDLVKKRIPPIKTNGNKGKKLPKGITREVKSKSDHSRSHELRLRLCEFIDDSLYNRKEICEKLYALFPNYKSAHSLGSRISDITNKEKAFGITRFLRNYKDMVAVVDPATKIIMWETEHVR